MLDPVPVRLVLAAVLLEAVLVESHPSNGLSVLGYAAAAHFARLRVSEDTAVNDFSSGIMIDPVDFAHVGNAHQTTIFLLDLALRQPVLERLGTLTFQHVTEILGGTPFLGKGIDDLLIESSCFADLPHGIAGESVATAFGEKEARLKTRPKWMLIPQAVVWSA